MSDSSIGVHSTPYTKVPPPGHTLLHVAAAPLKALAGHLATHYHATYTVI